MVGDDAQSGPDHVDGHRTVFWPLARTTAGERLTQPFYTLKPNMIRSIEMILGANP